MALRKGRKINVRDIDFFWKFKSRKHNLTGSSPVCGHVVVQAQAEEPGKPLVAYVERSVLVEVDWIEEKAAITPRHVRSLIEQAIDNGWDPTAASKQYNFPAGFELEAPEEADVCYKTVAVGS